MTSPPGQHFLHAELEVFADYNSFELTDEETGTDRFDSANWVDDWIAQLHRDQIAAGDGIIGIGTARRTIVAVTIDVLTCPPDIDVEDFDHVTEASLATTGTIIVSKQDYRPEAPRLKVPAGTYRTRVYTRGLETIDEYGLDGDDTYHVVLWPGEACEPSVVKRYTGRSGEGFSGKQDHAATQEPLRLESGDRVHHEQHGYGTVLTIRGTAAAPTVVIDFEEVGVRMLQLIGRIPVRKLLPGEDG